VLAACKPESEPDSNEACGDTIITRINPDTDFLRIKTFAVVDADDYPVDLPADLPHDTHRSILAANGAARASLLERGLLEVDPDFEVPDVWLFSLASTDSKVGYLWDCVPGYVWWGWSAGIGAGTLTGGLWPMLASAHASGGRHWWNEDTARVVRARR
jgi:hypothetical protein